MKFRSAAIRATGMCVPELECTNERLSERFAAQHPDFVAKMESKTGIRTRFYAPDSWATSDLAVRACQDALARANVAPSEVDLILVGTDSPDYLTPATSVVVQDKLGAKNAGTFDIGCACASFPTAVAAGTGLIATNPSIKNVLVVGAYLMHRLAPEDDPISFFYGDGAGAALLCASDEPGILGAAFHADGAYAKNWAILSGGTAEPASEESVREGRTQVRMYERYPPQLNDEGWPNLVRTLAAENDFAIEDVDRFVFTQVNEGTIAKAMDALGQPIEKAEMIMGQYGYTGSACIPMALDEAIRGGRAKAGDLIVLIGSGVGLNQAGVAVRLTDALVTKKGEAA
ncbi:MAG: ketoacyl-ACP synthase III [Deltaproteobacteria bacterium]